jgi:molybdate transport repressor ModE-like protein
MMGLQISVEPELRVGTAGSESTTAPPTPLLDAIRLWGFLAKAAGAVGCSYRHAWGLTEEWRDILGQPLATLEPGRGTRLTSLGERLLRAGRQARERPGPVLAELAAEIEGELTRVRENDRVPAR